MRILVISNRYPPFIMGGYEISCQLVVDGLRQQGHEVKVLTTTFQVNRKIVEKEVYRILHLSWASHKPHQLAWWEAADRRETKRLLAEFQPEVIFLWCGQGLFASVLHILMRQEIPLVYQIQDIWLTRVVEDSTRWAEFWQQKGSHLAHRLAKPLMKGMISQLNSTAFLPLLPADVKFDNAIFCSQFQRDLNRHLGFTAHDEVIIYNCVDTKRFHAREKKNHDPVKFLFTGRLCEDKGAHIALQAFNKVVKSGLTNATFSVVGIPQPPFEYFAELKDFVRYQGLESYVTFSEPVSNEQMPEVYQSHDVLLLPSFHKEGFSMVLLEAMACGLTVIGTTSGGSAEILKHEENSLTFAVGDAEMLALHIARLIQEPNLRLHLAKAAMQLVHEKFSLERMIDETEAYLLKVINR